ncbi:MAG: sulfotransferase [Solirubrobacterales bacterium]|nr:sulfotransferase [Solirubrobacterales bacterium]
MTASAETQAAAVARGGRMPDFFIVGQPKSGTTALYEMLAADPQIHMPLKEPWFFARDLRRQSGDGLPETLEQYLDLFVGASPEQSVGEATLAYLRSSTAAASIAELAPQARIIAILREPASFVRSLHMQFLQSHIETEKDLAKAIALEDDRRAGRRLASAEHHADTVLYGERVRYVEQLKRFYDVFAPEQVLVLIYDDFRADNEATVGGVLRFLELDDTGPVELREANPTVRVRSPRLNETVRAVSVGSGPLARAVKLAVKAIMPRRLRARALQTTHQKVLYGAPQPPDEALMLDLRRRFKGEVVALSEYLGRDLVTEWGYDRLG